MARSAIRDLAAQASLADETSSWSYRHDRDLAGFIDGSGIRRCSMHLSRHCCQREFLVQPVRSYCSKSESTR
jgi:hypothetical protein